MPNIGKGERYLFVPKPARRVSGLPRCLAGPRLSVRRRPPLSAAAAGHRYSVGYSSARHPDYRKELAHSSPLPDSQARSPAIANVLAQRISVEACR
jgi:hypothetical protein